MGSRYFDEIEAFLAVLEMGGFAAAADSLGHHTSVISRRVSALEARLGVRFIERSTRRMAATEAGLIFSERVKVALAAIDEAKAEVQATAVALKGVLKLALPLTFGEKLVAPLLPEFLKLHPAIRIEAYYSDRTVDMIAEGYDVAIRLGPQSDSRLISRRLTTHKRRLFAAPEYVNRHGAPALPQNLAQHACLRYTGLGTHPRWHLRRDGVVSVVAVSGQLDADDPRALLHAAIGGAGIIMCPDWMADEHLAAGRLTPILPDWTVEGSGEVIIVRPSVRFSPAKTKAFVDWIVSAMGTPQPIVPAEPMKLNLAPAE